MDFKSIKGNPHYLFDSLEEYKAFGNEDEVEEVHYEMMDYIKNDPHLGPAFSVLDSVGGNFIFY